MPLSLHLSAPYLHDPLLSLIPLCCPFTPCAPLHLSSPHRSALHVTPSAPLRPLLPRSDRFRRNFKDVPWVRVPIVYW